MPSFLNCNAMGRVRSNGVTFWNAILLASTLGVILCPLIANSIYKIGKKLLHRCLAKLDSVARPCYTVKNVSTRTELVKRILISTLVLSLAY